MFEIEPKNIRIGMYIKAIYLPKGSGKDYFEGFVNDIRILHDNNYMINVDGHTTKSNVREYLLRSKIEVLLYI